MCEGVCERGWAVASLFAPGGERGERWGEKGGVREREGERGVCVGGVD